MIFNKAIFWVKLYQYIDRNALPVEVYGTVVVCYYNCITVNILFTAGVAI